MRYLIFLVIIYIPLSCQRKNNDHDANNFLYSVDTVIIDSKEKLLDLKRGIWNSDLDNENRAIYLYNSFDYSIDKIDLDNLEFADNYPFEIEGPNGIGKNVNNINTIKEDLIFIKSFGKSAVFQKSGDLVKKIDWVNAIDSKGLKYGELPRNEIIVDSSGFRVFGLSYDNKNRKVFLDVLSVQNNLVKRFYIDSEKSYHNFVLAIDDPKNYIFLDPYVYLRSENNFIIISHQFSNELSLFNLKGEYVQTVNYEPKMTPKRVKGVNGLRISTRGQLGLEYQHFLEHVRFGPPVWDSVKRRYLRLSAIRSFSDTREEGSLLPEIQEVEVYLSVFDNEFNLLSESAIPELSTEYVKYFAKDGKLWVYQNFSDELGFIIIDI